jgi:hypothetical protein
MCIVALPSFRTCALVRADLANGQRIDLQHTQDATPNINEHTTMLGGSVSCVMTPLRRAPVRRAVCRARAISESLDSPLGESDGATAMPTLQRQERRMTTAQRYSVIVVTERVLTRERSVTYEVRPIRPSTSPTRRSAPVLRPTTTGKQTQRCE